MTAYSCAVSGRFTGDSGHRDVVLRTNRPYLFREVS